MLGTVAYGCNASIQTLDVCLLDHSPSSNKKYWIIYIHGGAWRDPEITASSFDNARQMLLSTTSLMPHIAGLASLNYRLSPHDQHPPTSSEDTLNRSATHPDHVNDILYAIKFLQSEYSFTDNYILVGHSCGASLALQVAISQHWTRSGSLKSPSTTSDQHVPPIPPVAVVGIEGIYDFPALVAHHADQPIYEHFFANAFGPKLQEGKDVWTANSPVAGRFDRDEWRQGLYVLLAHSRDDELVEWEQVDLMHQRLQRQGWVSLSPDSKTDVDSEKRMAEILELKGQHDQVWQDGSEVVRAIERCIQRLVDLPQ